MLPWPSWKSIGASRWDLGEHAHEVTHPNTEGPTMETGGSPGRPRYAPGTTMMQLLASITTSDARDSSCMAGVPSNVEIALAACEFSIPSLERHPHDHGP